MPLYLLSEVPGPPDEDGVGFEVLYVDVSSATHQQLGTDHTAYSLNVHRPGTVVIMQDMVERAPKITHLQLVLIEYGQQVLWHQFIQTCERMRGLR